MFILTNCTYYFVQYFWIYFLIFFFFLLPWYGIYFIYLLIKYNTITSHILITYELSNFCHVLGVVSQTRISGGNRIYDPYPNGVFFSSLKKCAFSLKKNAILCLFLKHVSPSKRVVCFVLKNWHLAIVKGIAFYALNKSWVLIIPCKADDFYLFIGLPDETFEK